MVVKWTTICMKQMTSKLVDDSGSGVKSNDVLKYATKALG